MVYSHLSAITGEETVNQQRRTVKASLTCNLTWHASADDRITYECFGFDLQTERHIEITPTLARVLIDALHLNNVPEDRSDAGIIRYSLESIQCVENEGCSTMVIPPCLP
jgi:hypothetical protein